MKKQCLNCNTVLEEQYKFCPVCGGNGFATVGGEQPKKSAVPTPAFIPVDGERTVAVGDNSSSYTGQTESLPVNQPGQAGAALGQQSAMPGQAGAAFGMDSDRTVQVGEGHAPQQPAGNQTAAYNPAPQQAPQGYAPQQYAGDKTMAYGAAPQQAPQDYAPSYTPSVPAGASFGNEVISAVADVAKKRKPWIKWLVIGLVTAGVAVGSYFVINKYVINKDEDDKTEESGKGAESGENVLFESGDTEPEDVIPTDPDVNEEGEILDNCYINEWANLKFDLGDDWTEKAPADYTDMGREYETVFSAYKNNTSNTELFIVDMGGEGYSADDFFDTKMDPFHDYYENELNRQIEEAGLDNVYGASLKIVYDESERFNHYVAEETFKALKVKFSYKASLYGQDIQVPMGYQYICVRIKDDKAIVICAYATLENGTKSIVNHYEAYK